MITVLLWFATSVALGQDLVRVWGSYQPPADVEAQRLPDGVDARFSSFGISVLTPPIRLFDDRFLWINGATYARVMPTASAPLLDDTSN
ncbi:MAG: hypothetical protein AAF211_31735, partial [Myxococcota bacterium]